MSYYNEYQPAVEANMSADERMERAFEEWQNAGKPAHKTDDFYAICDQYEIDDDDLADVIDDAHSERDEIDVYY